MLLREIFIGGARAPPAPPHATALGYCSVRDLVYQTISILLAYSRALNGSFLNSEAFIL